MRAGGEVARELFASGIQEIIDGGEYVRVVLQPDRDGAPPASIVFTPGAWRQLTIGSTLGARRTMN